MFTVAFRKICYAFREDVFPLKVGTGNCKKLINFVTEHNFNFTRYMKKRMCLCTPPEQNRGKSLIFSFNPKDLDWCKLDRKLVLVPTVTYVGIV